MNKLIKLTVMSIVVGLSAFVACKKDDSGSGATTSASTTSSTIGIKVDLLTGGSSKSWRASEIYYNDTLQPMDPCDADDRFIFTKSGNSFTINYGAIKCDPSETNEKGTWNLTDNDSTLEIDGAFSVSIQELTTSRLVFISYDTTFEEQPGGGTSIEVDATKQVWVNP